MLSVPSMQGQEWTRFRGPNGTGISEAKTVPVQWTEAELNWKTALPGSGHSSPVLWGSRIFVQAAQGGELSVVCVDERDGRVVWRKAYPQTRYDLHKFSSFASSTCAVDDERVYFTRQDGHMMFLCALQHSGEPAWEHPLGAFESQHGSGHSPVVYRDLVIVSNDQDRAGAIVAVERRTGKPAWSLPRRAGDADYSVPCVLEEGGRPPLLIFNTKDDGIGAVDPSSGKLVWATSHRALTMRSISSPVVAAGLTFASCGSGGGGGYLIAVQPPAGDATTATVKYQVRKAAPYVPTPIAYGGRVFLWSDAGIVTCLDPATGDVKWQERAGGNYFSSPVCVNGRIYGCSDSGRVVVIAAGDTFEVLGQSELGELTRATPAVANGRIYFRTSGHLLSVGGAARVTVRSLTPRTPVSPGR